MSARHMGWTGIGIAMAAAGIAAAGCRTPRAPDAVGPPGFTIEFDNQGCPQVKDSFGPAGSECGPTHAPDCRKVKHGQPVRFQRVPTGPKLEYVADFRPSSPFADGAPKVTSTGGVIEKNTKLEGTSPETFPFKMLAVAGGTCKIVDPQIILN